MAFPANKTSQSPLEAATGLSIIGARAPLPIGARLRGAEYVIEACLGTGGFAITYRAWEPHLGRDVAIKEFFPKGCVREGRRVALGDEWTAESFARYRVRALDEGRRLAALPHPGIVTVHAVFEENDTVYLVMEFVEGASIDHYLGAQGGRLSVEDAVSIVRQAADALAVVHSNGLLHRDLKPANLMRRPDGQIVLIDFGSARELLPDTIHTRTVTVTHGYAPLEQYSGRGTLEPSADVYALAATLYHMLTGSTPVNAPARAGGTLLPSPNALRPDLSDHLSEAVMRGLSMDPTDRPGDANEFKADVLRLPGADLFLISPRRRLRFLWRFIWISTLGSVIGMLLGMAVGNLAHQSWQWLSGSLHGAWAISGALAGAGLGIAQWLTLRRHLRHAWLWPVLTTVGAAAGNVLGLLVGDVLDWRLWGSREKPWAITGASLGLILGGAQWLLLRAQVQRARCWVFFTMVGKSAGNVVSVSIGSAAAYGSGKILGWAVGALVLVLAQALCLAFFRQKTAPAEPLPAPPDAFGADDRADHTVGDRDDATI